jgi:hypothetical protein
MEVTDGLIERLKKQLGIELSATDQMELKTAFAKDGEPSDADMLIMQYHISTEPYAENDDQVQMLHALTTAYFFRKFPNVTATAKKILRRHYAGQPGPDHARPDGTGSTH